MVRKLILTEIKSQLNLENVTIVNDRVEKHAPLLHMIWWFAGRLVR